jgi:trimethylamine---corrinoid protein Co-methyltransferase
MGHEKTLTGLTVALAGASLVYGAGMLDSGITFDCAQLVMDNEWAAMIKMIVGGIRVDDEMLMVDDIAKVGSFGDFLSLDSTYRLMRSQSQPQIMDRRVREEWAADGATDMYSRARLKAQEILESHQVEPIDADIQKQMRALVAAADAEKGVG